MKQKEMRHENYDTLDIDNKLVLNLRDLGHMIRFLFEGKGSQSRILIILNEHGSMTQRDLIDKLGIRPGSGSEVIGKLESAGLITRTMLPEDRRSVRIALTETGRQAAIEASARRQARHQEMFSCLNESEKETLLELVEELNEDWHQRYQDIRQHNHHHQG